MAGQLVFGRLGLWVGSAAPADVSNTCAVGGLQLDPAAVLPNPYLDPQTMAFVGQRPNLMQPDLFQAKLAWCRALVAALAPPNINR